MTPAPAIVTEALRAENADCTLLVTLSQPTPDLLRLHYHVHNRREWPLYLLNQLWQDIHRNTADQPVFEVLPNLVNVVPSPETVTVSKTVVDVPFPLVMEVRHIPCMTRVEVGASFEETIALPLPLMPYTVYQSRRAQGPVVSRSLHFELGYLLGQPQVAAAVEPVAAPIGTVFYTEPFPASYQSLIGVGPFQTAVPLTTRLDELPPKPAPTGEWTPWD